MTSPDPDTDPHSAEADAAAVPTTSATMSGRAIAATDAAGTVALLVTMAAVAVWPGRVTEGAYLAVTLVLFLGGCIAFAVGFLGAVGRSRREVIDMAGLFYLTGTAPRVVRRLLLGLWFIQIAALAVSLAVAPPFGVMAGVWGIGLLPLWGSRHGIFPARPLSERPGRRSAPQ